LVVVHELPRPRVLFVAADVPWPADGGGRIATLRNLQAFASFCDVDLLALSDPVSELDLTELANMCRSVTVVRHPFTFGLHRRRQIAEAARSLVSRWPYRIRKFRSPTFRRALDRLRAEHSYDLVHFDQFGVTPYWAAGVPSTYGCQNVESDLYENAVTNARSPLARLWARQEAWKLRFAEQRLIRRFDEVFVLAPEDAILLEAIGVERTRLLPMPAPSISPARTVPPARPTILSLGTMSWFGVEDGLLWFRHEVYPRILDAVPGVRWLLVGANAGPAIRRLHGVDAISLLGYVEDLAPILAEARVAIVPLHVAGGVRMKLLDLMAAGVPAVATSIGARGLSFGDGEGCFRRDEPATFADVVITLLQDDGCWSEAASRGRAYLGVHHTSELLEQAIRAGVADVLVRDGRQGAVG
jgi:glycosyltransferase involved in cell wall biosynthesis